MFSYRARYPGTPTTPPIFHTRGNFPGLGFLWLGFWTFNTLLNWWDFGAILAKYSRVTVEEQPRRAADGLNPGNRPNCRKCRRPNARGRKSNEPRTNHEKGPFLTVPRQLAGEVFAGFPCRHFAKLRISETKHPAGSTGTTGRKRQYRRTGGRNSRQNTLFLGCS